MKARFAAVIALVVGLAGEVSAVVVAGRISLGPALFLPGDYQFTTRHSEDPTPYDAFLFSSVDANTFQIETYTVGAGVTLYALQEGAAFSPANASSLPSLASNFGTGMGNQFEIPVGQASYFGIRTGQSPVPSGSDWFGWIRVFNNGISLIDQGSATDYSGQGIYTGTLTAVPEPRAVLLLLGLGGFLLRRRERRQVTVQETARGMWPDGFFEEVHIDREDFRRESPAYGGK